MHFDLPPHLLMFFKVGLVTFYPFMASIFQSKETQGKLKIKVKLKKMFCQTKTHYLLAF